MTNKPVLIIFVKNPELGKVKTRLAQGVGDQMALDIYKALLEHTRDVVLEVAASRFLFYNENIALKDDWPTGDFHKFRQSDDGLGERMSNAFEQAFERGSPVLIIGSDCAQITSSIIKQGFEALNKHDFVIGPAVDGGYYLLGMRAFHPSVFDGIEWSTDTVLEHTLNIIGEHKQSYFLLPKLSDIDYAEDWEKYGWVLG